MWAPPLRDQFPSVEFAYPLKQKTIQVTYPLSVHMHRTDSQILWPYLKGLSVIVLSVQTFKFFQIPIFIYLFFHFYLFVYLFIYFFLVFSENSTVITYMYLHNNPTRNSILWLTGTSVFLFQNGLIIFLNPGLLLVPLNNYHIVCNKHLRGIAFLILLCSFK